jgi:hypothetical protein
MCMRTRGSYTAIRITRTCITATGTGTAQVHSEPVPIAQ